MEVAPHMPYAPNIVFRMRWFAGLVLGAFIAVPLLLPGTPSLAPSPAAGRSPAARQPASGVAAVAARTPHKQLSVIVQMRSGAASGPAMRAVRAAAGRTTQRLSVINGFGARLSAAAAADLAQRDDVSAVSLDGRVAPQSIRASD